ncbi:cory-CC-star protein [Nitriliruptor alkaliphilus]|uniref:cory-CC-star protein n=1 Tax=Nitriliruptor alkaliphilus TaxID=427918 RepID=UPI001B804534|nr:cory-CC-star protein [Nitriliruptor alkaliphilus]
MPADPDPPDPAPRGGGWSVLARAFRGAAAWHEAVFVARWRGSLRRVARQEEDRFLAVLLLTSYGIDDPAAYETLELTPHLVQAFHDLHQREGLDRFPVHGVCC